MADWLEEGAKMPSFSLRDDSGNDVQSSQWLGRPVVIYFYPKDDTPGCTRQACAFRDAAEEIRKLGASIVGISCDSAESHAQFRDKYGLNFPLLVDEDRSVINAYGAFGEKVVGDLVREGILRRTYLIDPDGRIARWWEVDDPENHAAEVIRAVREAN